LKRRFRLNKRAISTVLATVFFLGIAISVAVTLFLMSSTYNNLYQQQLAVREERMEEKIEVLGWSSDYNISRYNPVLNFNLSVKNTGTVTAHIVSVYVNNTLVWNLPASTLWLAPLESGWTPLIPSNLNFDNGTHVGDNVTVSTDRGNTAVAHISLANYLGPSWVTPGNASETTPYCVNVQEINPQDPQKAHNPHLADVFRYSFWAIDLRNFQGPRAAYLHNPYPPDFDPYDLTGANYSTPAAPEGFIGVQAGRTYAVWAVETQYKSNGELIWCRVGPADNRPLTVTIPTDAKTYVWVARVKLMDYFGALVPHNVWDILIEGPTYTTVGQTGNQYGGSINFTGGVNHEDLKNVSLQIHIYNASTCDGSCNEVSADKYKITNKSPPGGRDDTIIKIERLPNGVSAEYYWMITWKEPAVTGKYRIKIYVEAEGAVTGNTYSTWSDNSCTIGNPSNCNIGTPWLDVTVRPR
jgi:hypothetical protein